MSHHRPFVVFSLPRSRSAWMSVFLSAPGRMCGHDLATTINRPEEFTERLQDGLRGTCETGAAFAWRLIQRELPSARFAVVRRDPAEVIASLERFGLTGLDEEVHARAAQLGELASQPGVLSLNFADLQRSGACASLYRHCLGEDMPLGWWAHLEGMNIQIDMRRRLELLAIRHVTIEAMKSEVRRRLNG